MSTPEGAVREARDEPDGELASRAQDPSSAAPRRGLIVVTCMDARIDVFGAMGIDLGDAHIIRNAGGLVTDDVLRSVALSQRTLGTTEIAVIQHTDCALSRLDENELRAEIRRDTGSDPPFNFGAFTHLEESVRKGVERLRKSPLLVRRDRVRGYIFDVNSGELRSVPEHATPPITL